jgi:hypothetical protein
MDYPTELPFRQVHLDFHTSGDIAGIGSAFDAEGFKRRLRDARVDSITLFSVCHHGWNYHPTKAGAMHPGLSFDLLGAQMKACAEEGVLAPVYVSAGLNQRLANAHPEWIERDPEGARLGWRSSCLEAGFDKLCLNSPYLGELCALAAEAARLHPAANGIFLDIIAQGDCACPSCVASMDAAGLDPADPKARRTQSRATLLKYYRRVNAAIEAAAPGMPVFHNSGHVPRGRRDLFPFFSRFELESLPTWSWGYDHFPTSARYVDGLGKPFLGMTGKFHTTWGEFGGYKHPNALRYECAAMLAMGARCSIGDQLHPDGELDEATYRIIGEAYREVEAKEAWCVGSRPVSDVALLSRQAFGPPEEAFEFEDQADAGAVRALLEEGALFDLVDREAIDGQEGLSRYALAIVPDGLAIDEALAARLRAFVSGGGALILAGPSVFGPEGRAPLDLGLEYEGMEPHCPSYVVPRPGRGPSWLGGAPLVSYGRSARVRPAGAEVLADVLFPVFDRDRSHFSSHQHSPYLKEPTGYAGIAAKGRTIYFAHPVFSQYRALGAVAQRALIGMALDNLLGDGRSLKTSLPSAARATMRAQEALGRSVVHLLYAPVDMRGGGSIEGMSMRSPGKVGIIEDLPAIGPVEIEVRPGRKISAARLAPQGTVLAMTRREDAPGSETYSFTTPAFSCHQMIELDWA